MSDYGAIILCGGSSTRMGRDKASLPFGDETLLSRVVRIVSKVVPPARTVCVAAEGQSLPPQPSGVRTLRDRRPQRGPLEALAVGMATLADTTDALFVTSCDAPLLEPVFIRRLFALLDDEEIVVPTDGTHHHMLAAVYRTTVLPAIESLLADDELRLASLVDRCQTRAVPVDEFRKVDPELRSLINCNQREDYHTALRLAGETPADESV